MTLPQTLLQRVASGDSDALRTCIDEYGGLVYSLAVRMLRPLNDDVDDAVQEVFTEVWRNAGRYDPARGSEATFIATIARHRIVDRQRRSASIRRTLTGAFENRVGPAEPLAADATLGDEAKRAADAFNKLDQRERDVLWFTFYQGLTQEQIAQTLNIPLGTVKTRARSGLIRLRQILGAPRAEGVAS